MTITRTQILAARGIVTAKKLLGEPVPDKIRAQAEMELPPMPESGRRRREAAEERGEQAAADILAAYEKHRAFLAQQIGVDPSDISDDQVDAAKAAGMRAMETSVMRPKTQQTTA